MSAAQTDIRERLARRPDPVEFEAIRQLWIEHSKAEDARSLDRLTGTLSEDCVYQDMWTGQRWEGHAGARRFYTEVLTAFPDIHFDLTDVVVGPQGVFEVADVKATFKGAWQGIEPDGNPHRWQSIIHFPWNPRTGRFDGEKVFTGPGFPGWRGMPQNGERAAPT